MKNIKPEIEAILAKYGDSELAVYRLQKLFEQYAQEHHKSIEEMRDRFERTPPTLLNMYDAQKDPLEGRAENQVVIVFKSKLWKIKLQNQRLRKTCFP